MSGGDLPVLCAGPPRSGLNLLSVLMDGHPQVLSGPAVNLFGHAALWRQGDVLSLEQPLDREAYVFPTPVWGPPASRNLSYYFVSVAEVRHVLTQSPDIEALAHLLYAPRRVVEQKTLAVDVSATNVFAARAALERGARVVFLMRDPIDSIARQVKVRLRPVFAAAFWVLNAAVALRLRAEFGVGAVHILRYEDLVSEPEQMLSDLAVFLKLAPKIGPMIERQETLRRVTDDGLRGDLLTRRNWRHDPFGPLVAVTAGADQKTISQRFLHVLHGLKTAQGLDALAPGGEISAGALAEALGYKIDTTLQRLPVLKPEEIKPNTAFEEKVLSCVALQSA